jgi:D-threo-aldose 1-dehydrogenase
VNRRPLGRTGLTVTELGFGTAPIGNMYAEVSDDVATAAVDAAWDAGVRFFDTAPHYGLGLAEARLGAALAGRPRDEFVVSTKVGRLLVPNPAPTGSDLARNMFAVPDDLMRRRDYSADGVRRSLESSLGRLGLDRVDVVLVHDPDRHLEQAIEEAIPALVALREEGVVGAVGVGMNQWEAELEVVRRTDVDVVLLAGRWTLLDRSGGPLLDACAERGVAVVAAGPFNSGLLARPEPPDDATFDYQPAPAATMARARELAATARAHGTELPQAALQFALRHPAVASVLTGLRTAAEVREAASRLTAPVPDALWDAVG